MSIITVSVGQCGTQVGFEFWKQLCVEHGLSADGTQEVFNGDGVDNKDCFFYQSDDDHFVPRAILLDTEPGVMKQIQSSAHGRLFNSESVYVAGDGSGAGNNWAHGYATGAKHIERICDMLDREAEGCDVLEGFMMTHSIAGGTGSGMGSQLLETLHDRYGKKLTQTFSVFAAEDGAGVNIAPYNSMLALKRLTLCADSVVVLDNVALYRVAEETLHLPHADMSQVNQLVSAVMAGTTATLRFPGFMHNQMATLLSGLIPTPRCHFLMTGASPIQLSSSTQKIETSKEMTKETKEMSTLTSEDGVGVSRVRKTSVADVMRRLLQQQNVFVSCPIQKSGVYLSMLNILQGDVDPTEVHKSLQRIRERQQIRMQGWGPAGIQVALAKTSPYVKQKNRVTGLMVANHTSIHKLFQKTATQYDKLRSRNAFLDHYTKQDMFKNGLEEFDDSRAVVQDLIEEYQAAAKDDFLQYCAKKEENQKK